MRTLIIAGKNDIAVNVSKYVLENYGDEVTLFGVCNKTETGIDGWQQSYRSFLRRYGVKECSLDEVYKLKDAVFLSLEFDQLVDPDYFFSNELYNVHFSCLPKYRGMYTSAWPILNGEKTSGVTLHYIDKGIDTGDIIDQDVFTIEEDETAESLYLKYIEHGTKLVLRRIYDVLFCPELIHGKPQDETIATYYSRKSIDYKSWKVDFNTSAVSVSRTIRALTFRAFQLPSVNGHYIAGAIITENRSIDKPGSVVYEFDNGCCIATDDFDICIYYVDDLPNVIMG